MKLCCRLLLAGLGCVLLAPAVLAQKSERLYLSGHDKDDGVPWKFFCTAGEQSGYWTNIMVPFSWEIKGFGILRYRWDATNGVIDQGRYEHAFTIPAEWAGKRIFLVFEGVQTDTRALFNGVLAGPVHQGGFYRFKYEVTKLAKCGETNLLEVTVAKHSENEGVNNAERMGDYWQFGGIYRPVYLEAEPQQFIERVAMDARADGSLAMDVFGRGISNADMIEAQIFSLDGTAAGPAFGGRLVSEKATLKTTLANAKTWTAETPNLYRVEVRLKQDDKVVHEMEQRFGFRTMEVREGDGLYVNGKRVLLKGSDRHSFWPESGRTLSETVHRLDIGLMKEMNMNAVRMSHYPPDQQFLDLCDELGLYVLDELGGWAKSYDTPTGHKLVEEMVTRDVNHPSILFWDNGNEGGWNTNVDGDFGRWDPQQRRVLHPFSFFNNVNTFHYATYAQFAAFCASNMVFLPTEFQHGLYDGGAGSGLEDYWDVMRKSPVAGGAILWAFLDEGVKRPDTGQIDVWRAEAPDGIVGPYREKEASFFAIREIWTPIVITNKTLPADFAGKLDLENRYDFIDAKDCSFTWELRKLRRPDETGAGYRVVSTGNADAPAIPPRSQGELKLNLPENWRTSDTLALTVKDPAGRELWTWVWPLAGADDFRTLTKAGTPDQPGVSDSADELEVRMGPLTVAFSKKTGFIESARRGTQSFSLSNGPRPAAGEATLTNLAYATEGNDYVVTARYDGALDSVRWRVQGNGWVQCDYTYTASGPKNFMGVMFDYPEAQVKGKRWLGDGPYRVWKNRLPGVTLNVWENAYNNTITGWSNWIYPEFKGCFADVRWLQLETTEGSILAVPGTNGTYVQVLTPLFPPRNYANRTIPPLPRAGLAFLDAIPAMGNKFYAPAGPHGQMTRAEGQYSGSVSFYFGDLK